MRKALGFTTNRPPTTPMGDYNTDEKLEVSRERDKLFARVNMKPKSDREGG